MKKLISALLVLVLLVSLVPCALADGETVTNTCAAEFMMIAGVKDSEGPIHITKAQLTRNGNSDKIYLVLLAGVQSPLVNPNNLPSALTTLFSAPSPYLNKVISLCLQNIPRGSKLVFVAHSLGGMVAQLFAATPSMKARYEILNITAFGSPLVNTKGREGELHRLVDISDPMVNYSITGLRNYTCYTSYEDGGFDLFDMHAHVYGYRSLETWGEYDCFGVKGGDAVITYNTADMFVYAYSPYTLLIF